MSGAVFDAGALIAFEKADRRVVAMVVRALERGAAIAVPAASSVKFGATAEDKFVLFACSHRLS